MRGCWPYALLAGLPSEHPGLALRANSGGRCIERRLGHPTLLHSAGRETEAGGPGACSGPHSHLVPPGPGQGARLFTLLPSQSSC